MSEIKIFIEEVYTKLTNKYFNGNKNQKCRGKLITLDGCISCQRDKYFDSRNINYECDIKKDIYILRYMPVHFSEIKGIINTINIEKLNKKTLNILSLGGGSGIDIMAVNSWIKDNREKLSIENINYTIIDKEDSWNYIFKKIKNIFFLNNMNLNYNIDISKVDEFSNIEKNYDLVIMSYLISELNDILIDILVEKLKHSRMILINDRNDDSARNNILKFKKYYESKCKIYNNEYSGISYNSHIFNLLQPKTNKKSIGCIIYNDN